MEPTFHSGEYILTSKITYKFRQMERGDVVVFRSLANPDIDYIKRIIGLPGDTVEVRNSDVYVNGKMLDEGYIADRTNLWEGGFLRDSEPVRVPEGEVFVMGDNRPHSSDSREFGFVPIENLIGQVFYRYFPSDKIGGIENPIPKDFQSLEPYLLRSKLVGQSK